MTAKAIFMCAYAHVFDLSMTPVCVHMHVGVCMCAHVCVLCVCVHEYVKKCKRQQVTCW